MEAVRIAAVITGLVVVLGFLTTRGASIKCYECNSAYDPRCGDPIDNYTLGMLHCDSKEVPEHLDQNLTSTICRKIVQKTYGKVRVVRKCGFMVDKALKEGKSCVQRSGTHDVHITYCACEGDFCNGGTRLWHPLSLLLTFLVTAAALRKVAIIL